MKKLIEQLYSKTLLRLKTFSTSQIFKKNIRPVEMIAFFRQFSTLISSNIPILQSIEMLYKSQNNMLLKSILIDLKYNVERGRHLSYSLNKFSKYFDEITCCLLAMGESSGTFDVMLQHVAHYKEKSYQFNHQIKKSLFYPAIISIVAISICLIMLLFIVPRFNQLFHEANVLLPPFTLAVIKFSDLIQSYALLLFIPIFFVILINRKKFRHLVQRAQAKIPIIGSIINTQLIINFTRYLAVTLKAGLAINEAIPMIARTTGNPSFEQALLIIKQSIEKGHKINYAMKSHPHFTPLMIEMIRVGEETGKLDYMLEKITAFYENELNQLISYLGDLLEPLIMVILGVLIGGLVVAMYLPIFKLGTIL